MHLPAQTQVLKAPVNTRCISNERSRAHIMFFRTSSTVLSAVGLQHFRAVREKTIFVPLISEIILHTVFEVLPCF